jgi:uncharacterized membrane protein
MIAPFIPALLVGFLAFVAAICVAALSYMPRTIRAAIVIPTVYFGCIYVWASTTNIGYIQQVDIVRLGIVGLLFSEIVTAIPYLWRLHGDRLKARLATLRLWLAHRNGRGGNDGGGTTD